MKINKEKEKTTKIHKKKDATIHKEKNIRVTNKAKSGIKTAGITAGQAVVKNVDGGDNIADAMYVTEVASRPVKDMVSGANGIRKKIKSEKAVKQQTGGVIRKKTISQGTSSVKKAIASGSNLAKKSAKKTAKERAKKSSKKVSKDATKEVAKTTAKVTSEAGTTVAGSTAGPYGAVIGLAVGEKVGQTIDKMDYQNTQRMRKFKFMIDKLQPQDKQNDNFLKLVGDTVKNNIMYSFRKIGKMILSIVAVLLVIIIAIGTAVTGVVTIMYNSPLALFLPPLSDGETVHSVTTQYVSEFNEEIKKLADEHKDADKGRIIYVDYEGMSTTPSNYYDIMCVYMVKYGYENTATEMNDKNKADLKAVFDDMCSYTTKITSETEGKGKNKKKVKYLDIDVKLKTYIQMVSVYSFSENQTDMLNQLMKAYASSGSTAGTQMTNLQGSLTAEEIRSITDKITDATQKTVVNFALSKVGFPYSQEKRDSGTAFDCSSLAYYAWQSAGINISYNGSTTAAAEANGLEDKKVKEENLQPGDLIFYSYTQNGRYKNISHVGIYVGSGKMVEAVDPAHGVCLCDYHNASMVMICRPNKK